MTDKKILWVKESPYPVALGDVVTFSFDFTDIGTPSAVGATLCYDQAGTNVSATALSGAASLTGAVATSKTFTPASAQAYTLVQPVTISGNTVKRGVILAVYDLSAQRP